MSPKFFSLTVIIAMVFGCSGRNFSSSSHAIAAETPPPIAICLRGYVTGPLVKATHKKCEAITDADLAQIQELDITDQARPGELQGLTSLKKLTFRPYSNYGHYWSIATFRGLENLESLMVDDTQNAYIEIESGAFLNLKKLQHIEFRTDPGSYQLASGQIDRDAFAGLESIQSIDFVAACAGNPNPAYVWFTSSTGFRGVDSGKIHYDLDCFRTLVEAN